MFLEQAFFQTVGNQKNIRVLDLCAAPGGKSTHLLSMLDNTSVMAGVSRINVNTAGKLFQFSNADGLSAADSFRDRLERWIAGKKPTKSVSEKMTSDQQLDEVTIDNRQGAGETPNHSNIDYLGLRVKMRPSVFLKLTPALAAGDSAAAMIDLIKQGGAIAAAQLYVDIPGDWDTGDLLDPATVRNHEGRHRMRAVLTVEGDDPVEVHILPQGLRRHHLTDAMIADMQQRLIPQGRVLAVTEGELGEKLFEMSISEDFHHRARPGSRPGSLRRKAGKKEGEKITATDLRRLAARARKMKQSNNAETRQRGGASRCLRDPYPASGLRTLTRRRTYRLLCQHRLRGRDWRASVCTRLGSLLT